MELYDKDLILRDIPLFFQLSEPQRKLIGQRSAVREYKKGSIIYHEGDPADAFYCVALGRVKIYNYGQSTEERDLEYLHRGKYFGIISLLTNEPHSVTAKALNDCLLLVINKEDFDFILKKIPRLAIDLSKTLSRRLKRKDLHQKTIFESTIVSVFSSYAQAGKSIYALNLALSLKNQTRKSVIILDIAPLGKTHSLPRRLGIEGDYRIAELTAPSGNEKKIIEDFSLKNNFGVDLICFSYQPEDESCLRKMVAVISMLVNDYHYLILDLPSSMDRAIFSILNQSDVIHILTSPDPVDLKRTRNLIERLKSEFNFQEEKIKAIINEYRLSKLNCDEQLDILGRAIFATLPKIEFQASGRLILDDPDCEYARAVRRISRQLGECTVGLVLGVGVAYGFCHIGVLKVIEEEKIPVDIITGSSIGALIAAFWAAGYSSKEIEAIISGEFKEPKHIWSLIDLTVPFLGFIKGNKLLKFLKKYLGNKTFYDTRLPLKVIASDVKRKEPRVIDKGLLVDAVLASCSMPGVFAPFRFSRQANLSGGGIPPFAGKEEMLFDGGVSSPLPTEVLFKLGVKKIIAVNVTPSREDILHQYERLKEEVTVNIPQTIKKKQWFGLKNELKVNLKTNIFNIIFSSVEVLQSQVAEKEAQLADIVLHPDTSGLFWLDLHKAQEFIRRGEDEARRNLSKIKQLVEE
ncbi:MAG: patatin-like phospholipase family protein [Candidatus Omnitrophota bacterium]